MNAELVDLRNERIFVITDFTGDKIQVHKILFVFSNDGSHGLDCPSPIDLPVRALFVQNFLFVKVAEIKKVPDNIQVRNHREFRFAMFLRECGNGRILMNLFLQRTVGKHRKKIDDTFP